MFEHQQLISCALITNKKGEVLIAQRADKESYQADMLWELPGGKVEFGEDPAETAERETKEEVGIDITVTKALPHIASKVWQTTVGERHCVVLCYAADYTSGHPRPLDKKIHDVRWVSWNELKQYKFLPTIPKFLESYKQLYKEQGLK